MGTIRVLHVDDDPGFSGLVADCLAREDDAFEVYTETSVDAALDHLFEDGVDCVVSDYDMPETDGLEFLELVREHDESLPFILFTGKGSESVASDAFSAGATDYLRKEAGTDQFTVLANRVRNYVEQRRIESRRRTELAAFEAAQEGIALLDDDGRFTYVNEAYADLYGYDPEEMVGKHWELVYPPEEVAFARDVALPAAEAEGHWHGRTTGLRADGSTFVEDHVLARTDDGDLACAVRDASAVDVDEAAFQRYETIVEALNDPVYALDDEGRFVDVNDAFLELTGYDRETVLGATPDLIKDEAAVETAERNLARLLSSEGPDSVTFEITLQTAEGDQVPVEDHMGVLWEDDSFAGSVGALRDISERVEARERLRAEKRLLDRSLDALSDIYYFLDPRGNIQRWNSSLEAVTGYSGDELEGRDALTLFEGEDRERIAEAVTEALDAGSARVEAALVTKSGRAIPYEFTGARLDDEDGDLRGVIGVGRDVTRRRADEQRLERKNERLEEFASVVSHDLRNPLNVAQGQVEMLRKSADEAVGADLDALGRSLDRMEALVEDLLTLAREGETVDEIEPVALPDVLGECWETVDPDGAATLRVETDATIRADRSRLRQLAENLLSNAAEHAGADVTVTVGDTEAGFFIADDGPGIPAEEREQVFESGYSTTRQGTGFGLSIVESVASAHDWTVELTESADGGARFEFGDVAFIE